MAEVKKPRAQITISRIIDIESVTRYYKLQSASAAAPSKPTDGAAISSDWTKTEPAYQNGATNRLYFVDQTIMTNGDIYYSQVSLSSSYEAAKEAWNKANNAQKTANDIADNIYYPDTVEIDGNKLRAGTVAAKQINVEDLFAQNISAKGTIAGVNIKGASGEFTKDFVVNTLVSEADDEDQNIYFKIYSNEDEIFIGLKSETQANSYISLNALSAALVGLNVTIGGVRSVNISAQQGMTLNCPNGVSVNDLSVTKDIRAAGNFYRKGNIIGETLRGTGTQKTIKNATWTSTGAYLKLPAGVYVLMGTNAFAASKGGRLAARFADSTQGYDVTAQVQPGMPSSMTAWVQCQWIVSITEETTYHLQAYQQTGADLAVTGNIKAVRIA